MFVQYHELDELFYNRGKSLYHQFLAAFCRLTENLLLGELVRAYLASKDTRSQVPHVY